MRAYRMVLSLSLAFLTARHGYADTISDEELLARKFSPILILTKDEQAPNRRVLRPEPVEIVGAQSAANLRFEITGKKGSGLNSNSITFKKVTWESFPTWEPPLRIPGVDFSANRFAFLPQSYAHTARANLPGAPDDTRDYTIAPFFDYPGNGKESWNKNYFGTGPHGGEPFPNTAYVHIYKTTDATYPDSITVIQYFYFYPYNDSWNNHEGDWPRVHVVVNSSDPNDTNLQVLGVEYLAHGAHLSYYRDYGSKPNITSNFVFDPQTDIRLNQGTHPVIYVGAGSHGSYPTGGRYTLYEADNVKKSIVTSLLSTITGIPAPISLLVVDQASNKVTVYERMTHTGLVLSTEVNGNSDLQESYDLAMLPAKLDLAQTNKGLTGSMSWFGADVRWGDLSVPAGNAPGDILDKGNKSPRGPYHKGWEDLKLFTESIIGLKGLASRDFGHGNIPYSKYHHCAIVGDESWSGTLTLRGDIVVLPGATLTIESGTVVEFEPETDIHQFPAQGHGDDDLPEIFVYGTLTTQSGTPIQFRKKSGTSWQGQYAWGGIRIMPGGSAPLDNAQIRDMAPPPSPPSNLTVEPGDGQVTLSWGAPAIEDPTIAGWQYRRKEGVETLGAWGGWTGMLNTEPSDTEYTVENLQHGVFHKFQVRAVNTAVVGDGGDGGPPAEAMKVGLLKASYSAETYDVVEGKAVEVTVRLTPPADRSVTIPVQGIHSGLVGLNSDPATAADYSLSTSTLRFDVGDNSKRLTLTALSDTENEEKEVLILGFGTLPAGVRPGSPVGSTGRVGRATVSIHPPSATLSGGTIPDAPSGGTATTRLGEILVSWDAVTATPSVTGYTLRFQSNPVWTSLVGWSSWNVCPLPVATSTTFTHEGLSSSRKYRYQLQATNSRGDSDWSDEFPPNGVSPLQEPLVGAGIRSLGTGAPSFGVERFVIEVNCFAPLCGPSGPTFPSTTDFSQFNLLQYRLKVGNGLWGGWGSVSISGASPGSRGARQAVSSPITISNSVAAVDDSRPIVSTYRVTDLDNTKTYQFQVRAVNADGVAGEASDSVAVVPLRGQAGIGRVTLSWDNSGNEETIEEWQYRQQRGRGSWGDWQDIASSTSSTTSHTVTGLANGEEYWFQVRAVYEYAAGDDRAGAVSFSRQVTLPDVPDVPENLEAEVGDGQVSLTWETPANNGSALTGYEYRRSADGAVTWSPDWGDISDSDSTTTSHTLMSLTNGVEYTFEVRAVNGVGAGDSSRVQATPGRPPGPPRHPRAPGANGQVTLSWVAPVPGDLELTAYEYRQSADGGATWSPDWTAVASPPGGPLSTRQPLPGLASCTNYTFEVRARNDAGAGDSVRVLALAPKWSGSLSSDTTWSGAVCADGEVSIPSGVTLSLGSGTEVSFSPGALIVAGTLGAGPGVTFRSSNAVSPSPSAWSGIRVESGGSADLSGATIRDGGGCVQAHTSGTVTMTNTTLSNCDEEVSLSTKRPQPGVALTASLEGVSAGSWQWQGRNDSDSAPWSDLSGSSTSASYTPLRADLGRQLRAMVRYVPDAGSYSRFVQSEPTRGVMLPPPTGFEVWPDHEAVLLIWDASADAGITHWRYGKRKRPAKMEWTKVADGEVARIEYEGRRIRYIRVEDLTNGVEYLFRVRAQSAAAKGVLTDPVLVTPGQPQVAFGASSYEAREGGEPVSVEVALSAKATRAVALPVTVTSDAGTEAGDYTVAGLTEEAGIRRLSFALGDSTASFTLTANEDSDGVDETVSLGFGDLPAGVSAGTQASAQVTLVDVPSVILVPPPNPRPNPPAGATAVSFAEESSDTVATYRLSAPDPGAVLTLKKEGPDAASFRIRGDTLYFKEMENFPDFEAPADVADGEEGVVAGDNDYVVGLYTWDGSLSSDTVAVTVSVRNVDEAGMVSVSPSSAQVGTQLKATLRDPDGSLSDTLWQWQRRAPGVTVWTEIEDSTLSRFLPGDTDAGQYLRATVSYTDGHGPGKSAVVIGVPSVPGNFAATRANGQMSLSWSAASANGVGHRPLPDALQDHQQRFTIQAESDIVEEESGETLELGFGSPLPVGVRAGTPSTATVTLSETGTPGTIPDTLTAGLGANSTTAGQIRVVWDASTDMTVSGYTLRFEIGHAVARDLWVWPGIWNLCPLPALGVDSTGFTHRDLQAWRRYRYQVQATNPHGDSEWSTSFPPSGVTPVPNKAAAGDVSVEPSEQSSEESEKKWEVEFIVLECSRPPCEQEEFEPFPDPDSDPDLPPDSGPTFPIDFEVLVNSGGVLGAYRLASPFSGAPGDGEAGGGASGTSGASGARGASSDGATATSVRVEAAGDTVRVSGLADTVVHQIRVRLVNADGVPGVASDSVAVVPLRAQAGDGQVTLSWDSPGHDRLEEWQYRQRRGIGSWGDWQDVPGSTASTTSHTVTGLANGETYRFQVRGVYELAAGSYRAGAVSFSRQATPVGKPGVPGNLSAESGDAQVTLRWVTPSNKRLGVDGVGMSIGRAATGRGEETVTPTPPRVGTTVSVTLTDPDVGVPKKVSGWTIRRRELI